MYNWVRDKKPM